MLIDFHKSIYKGGANQTKNSKETKAPNEPKFSNNLGLASVLNYELDL
nr:hypothetical protein [Rickettsia conorii]